MTAPDRKKLKTLNDPVDLIEDNERPSTGDVRVRGEAVRAVAAFLSGIWASEDTALRVANDQLLASGYPQRIAELEAENTRLKKERDSLAGYGAIKNKRDAARKRLSEAKRVIESQGHVIETVKAENSRLRMVLQHAVNYEEHRYTLAPPPPAWFNRARAALNADSQETE